jgi:hypothetical protein
MATAATIVATIAAMTTAAATTATAPASAGLRPPGNYDVAPGFNGPTPPPGGWGTPPFSVPRELPTDIVSCARNWRVIVGWVGGETGRPVTAVVLTDEESQNRWLNDPLLVHLVRPGPTRTGLSRNHSHLTGGVVANVVVPTADYVLCGAHYGFWPIGARRVVSVRLGPGEEHQTELAHLNRVAVG